MKKKERKEEEVDLGAELDEIMKNDHSATAEEFEVTNQCEIEIDKIKPPKDGLRDVPGEDIKLLAASIGRDGLLQPIVISKDGTLIAGNRRLLAHQLLKRKTIRASVVEIDADDRYRIGGLENIQRKKMEPAEEGRFYSKMLEDKGRFPTQKSLAEAMGLREASITTALQAAGKGTKYPGAKEKKEAREGAKEKIHRIKEESLPPGVTAVFTKSEVHIAFKLKIEDAKHVKGFDVKKAVITRLAKITAKDFSEEMNISLNSL